MNHRWKDRLVDLGLILLFLIIVAGSAYWIIKIAKTWRVKGLG